MKVNKRNLILLSLLTLVGMGGLGLASIFWLQKISPYQLITSGESLPVQLAYGLSYGVGASLLALAIVSFNIFEESTAGFTEMIADLNPGVIDILFYSACAAIGEELLFRGGIQPFLGIWFTSLLFISLHGYLKLTDPVMLLFGIFMVGISAGMGYLLVFHGIYASIASHFIYDVVMFLHLRSAINADEELE